MLSSRTNPQQSHNNHQEKPSYYHPNLNLNISLTKQQKREIMTPRQMYSYDTHTNIPWNDTQYQPLKDYQDPIRLKLQRQYLTQKKGQKDTKYKTKRGFYMDYHIKIMKQIPGSDTYKLNDNWQLSEHQKTRPIYNRKVDSSLSKYNYLDWIETQQKNRATPGVGKYNLNKTDSQIKQHLQKLKSQKRNIGQKRYFYEDTQHLSGIHQGMGAYHPHDNDIPHLKMNKTDYKFWSTKHIKQQQSVKKKNLKETTPCHYTPMALQYNTFDRIKSALEVQRKKKKQNKNGFGTDAKFTYDRPNKKKILQKRPNPGDHNVFITWKGKKDETKAKGWLRTRSTGFSQGVYH